MKRINGFGFITRYLGFLKHIPLLPHLFDTQLKLWSLIVHPGILDGIDIIEAEVLSWNNTNTTLHKYGGLQFNCNRHEIGHVHSNGILDIRFSRAIKQQLLQEGLVQEHHVFVKSGWISFYIRQKEDSKYALQLLRMAYLKIHQTKVIHPSALAG